MTNKELDTSLIIDETLSENTRLTITDGDTEISHMLDPISLRDLIRLLEFVREKKNNNVIDNSIRSTMRGALSLSSIKKQKTNV